jgi:hypothetical protein
VPLTPRGRGSVPSFLAGTVLVLLIACAKMGAPPGGPVDKVPPKLLSTVPESLGVYPDWHQDVEFRFDEVVSEGSSPSQGLGTGDLERLILLSPSKRIPVIKWKRDRITVHPREGWERNRTYRVQLLPGLQDLTRNRTDTTAILTFSTGGPIPSDTISGIVIDWVQGKVTVGALVELLLEPDSLTYRTLTDSGGRYSIGPLPAGRWEVFGVLDQNHNLRRDRRESYDSTELAEGAHRARPLWAIPRDSLGPRIQSITPDDSVSATIAFSEPLDPYQHFDSLTVSFTTLRDSVPVPFRSLLPKPVDDSLQRIAQARTDSIRLASDTTRRDTTQAKPKAPPRPTGRQTAGPRIDAEADSILKSRPPLFDRLVLRADTPFTPDGRYEVEIGGIRSAAGIVGHGKSTLVIPKPRPVPADTVKVRADTTTPTPALPTPP